MKTIFFAFTFLLPFAAFSQKDSLINLKKGADTLYTKSGFKVYVGQKLQIGVGTMPDGDFKYITSLSIFHSMLKNTTTDNQANAFDKGRSGLQFPVIRIDRIGGKSTGYIYYPIIKYDYKYEVDIDNAIATGEIVVPNEFKPKAVKENVSVADELIKLKKLKDSGVLTDEEFQVQKKKILGE